MRGVAALLLLLLLVSSSASAWEGGVLDGVAVRDAVLTGTSLVVGVGNADEGVKPDLSLTAQRIRVAEHRSYEEYNPPLASVTTSSQKNQTSRTWEDATVTLSEARPHIVLFINSTSAVRLEDARMSVGGHFQSSVQETSTTNGERPLSRVEVPTLHRVSSSNGVLTLTGDFTLSVWDWDLRVQNGTAAQDHWSGSRNATGPLSPAVNGKENQRLYLDVTNGTLRLSLAGLGVRDLFVGGTSLRAASAVLDLAGQDSPLSLAGPLHFGLGPVEDGSFPGQVLPPDGGAVEVPLARPDPSSPHSSPTVAAVGEEGLWTTSLFLLVLAVLTAVLVGWRAARLLRLRRAMSDGDYGSVAAGAGLESSRRFGAEVVVARVVSMVKTDEYAAAAALLEKRGAQLTPAVCAYLWACVHAGSGAVDDARDAVIRSIVADPAMAVEVAANGSLRRFLADVEEGAYS